MAIEYRLATGDELELLFDLWVEVYQETRRDDWKREFLSIPGSREHIYVAVDNGRVLATALLWVREMNDFGGVVRRAGNVSHVATHPGARRQGHARHLLARVLEEIQQKRCDLATLFASEEAKPLYEKLLWRTHPLPFWEGQLVSADLPRSTEYFTRPSYRLEEPYLWEVLADIHREFNEARPFAVQRDLSTWKSFTAHKITDWVQAGASVWLAYANQSPQAVCGYMIAHRSEHGFLIAEIGVQEQHRAVIPNLLHGVLGSYKNVQGVGGRLYFPDEPDMMAFIQRCFQPLRKMESRELMVRIVDPQKDLSDLMVSHAERAGMFWLLDQV